MNCNFYYIRFARYYKKYGLLHSIQRVLEKAYQAILKNEDHVFYSDLMQIHEQPLELPSNIIVKSINSESQLEKSDLEALFNHIGEKIILHQMKRRFLSSATLWVIKVNSNLAGYLWSAGRSDFGPYYFPIGDKDAFLFDGSVLAEYRGKNLYPLLLSNVFHRLRISGWSRAIYNAHEWNHAVIKSFMKVGAKRLGIVKKYEIGRRRYLLWIK